MSFEMVISAFADSLLTVIMMSGLLVRMDTIRQKKYLTVTGILVMILTGCSRAGVRFYADGNLLSDIIFAITSTVYYGELCRRNYVKGIAMALMFVILRNSAVIISEVFLSPGVFPVSGFLFAGNISWSACFFRYGIPYALLFLVEGMLAGMMQENSSEHRYAEIPVLAAVYFLQYILGYPGSAYFTGILTGTIWKTAVLPAFTAALMPLAIVIVHRGRVHTYLLHQQNLVYILSGKTHWKQLEETERYHDDSLITKHNLVQHLRMIEQYIRAEEYEQAEEYIRRSLDLYRNAGSKMQYCADIYLDAVLRYMAGLHPDYVFSVTCRTGNEKDAVGAEIGIILMNMIDERIRGIDEHHWEKAVVVDIRSKGGLTYLTVDSQWEKDLLYEPENTILLQLVSAHNGILKRGCHTATDLSLFVSL